ncbi:MAG: hypothetical protein AAF721_15675, partial [Myxococcota bacterium]
MGRARHRRWFRTAAAILPALGGCVVVSSVDVGDATDDTDQGDTTAHDDAATTSTPTGGESGDDAGSDSTGDASGGTPLPASEFPIYWAVTPGDVAVPPHDGAPLSIDHDVYIVPPPALGSTPATIADLDASLHRGPHFQRGQQCAERSLSRARELRAA